MTITCRPMIADDRQFVISGWSSSLRTSIYAGMISNKRWAAVMHPEIEAILNAPTTSTLVAYEPGELDHEGRQFLYGFIATRTGRPYVYYCYVKKPYRHPRKFRIARQLFAAADTDPTVPFGFACRTGIGDRILATCRCGLHRNDHIAAADCPRFAPKFRGTWDPVPAREAAA